MLQSISPGLVDTDIVPKALVEQNAHLQVEDISATVLYVLSAPPHVQVLYSYDELILSFIHT